VKALPKMAEKATGKQLKQGFLTHFDETRTHVQRLEIAEKAVLDAAPDQRRAGRRAL